MDARVKISLAVTSIAITIAGCFTPSVRYEVESTEGSATTRRTLSVPMVAPEDTGGGESFTRFVIPSDGSPLVVESHSKVEGTVVAESDSQKRGALLFYGCSAVCGFLALVFVGFKHFKLAGLSGIATAGFATLGVTLGRFPILYAYASGFCGLAVLFYIGIRMWADYKDDGLINLSTMK